MLLASVLIAGFTLRLLSAQDAMLQDALIESDSEALALLANRVEHALVGALHTPFQALKNAAVGDTVARRLELAASDSPEVRHILLLDTRLRRRNKCSSCRRVKESLPPDRHTITRSPDWIML